MLKVLKVVLFVFFLSQPLMAELGFGTGTFGGEVPWPLSNQKVVSVDNTRGLWKLRAGSYEKVFNVEMISHTNGIDWIRVSELDPKSFKVISWGEGFFRRVSTASSQSSYSSISLGDFVGPADRLGRYIYMFPNGDIKEHPYLVRLVEVETSVGNVLGISLIRFMDQDFEHLLGRRLLKKPLSCHNEAREPDDLACYFEGPF